MKFFTAVLTVFLLGTIACRAQFSYKVRADSLRVYNDTGNAELIIENSTRNVSGYLFNLGNGRTAFKTLAWADISGKPPVVTGAATPGEIALYAGSATLTGTSYLTWDNINNALTTYQLVVGNSLTGTTMAINGANTYNRQIIFKTNNSDRWYFRVNSDNETGSNKGSNLQIINRNDTGATLNNFFTGIRSTGNIIINGTVDAGYKLDVQGTGRFTTSITSPLLLLTTQLSGDSSAYLGQGMATSDNWKIFGSGANDQGELVFQVGDNASSFAPFGERFRFNYTSTTPGTQKDAMIIDYSKVTIPDTVTVKHVTGLNLATGSIGPDSLLVVNSGNIKRISGSAYLPITGGILSGTLQVGLGFQANSTADFYNYSRFHWSVFTDSSDNYTNNISSLYTNRSKVDKGYTDSAIAHLRDSLSAQIPVSKIVAKQSLNGAAAYTLISYPTPNNGQIGNYDIGSMINIKAITTDVLQFQVVFYDETNTFRIVNIGSGLATIGYSAMNPVTISVYPGTNIAVKTILTTGGGTISYNAQAYIRFNFSDTNIF